MAHISRLVRPHDYNPSCVFLQCPACLSRRHVEMSADAHERVFLEGKEELGKWSDFLRGGYEQSQQKTPQETHRGQRQEEQLACETQLPTS